MLYRPDLAEIRPLMATAKRAWPHLASRIDRATAILEDFTIRYDDEPLGWQIASQGNTHEVAAEQHQWYAVDMGGCACYDYVNANGNRANGRIFCKHAIAWLGYRRILNNRLEALVDLAPASGRNLRRITHLKEPVILQMDGCLIGADYDGEDLRIQIGYNYAQNRRTFRTDADMARFSHWLHAALPALRYQQEQRAITAAAQANAYRVPVEDLCPAATAPLPEPASHLAHGWLVPPWEQKADWEKTPTPAWEEVPA